MTSKQAAPGVVAGFRLSRATAGSRITVTLCGLSHLRVQKDGQSAHNATQARNTKDLATLCAARLIWRQCLQGRPANRREGGVVRSRPFCGSPRAIIPHDRPERRVAGDVGMAPRLTELAQ